VIPFTVVLNWVAGLKKWGDHETRTRLLVRFVSMVAILIGAALAASMAPTRKASRTSPVTALRQE